jgi:hypothetical protein
MLIKDLKQLEKMESVYNRFISHRAFFHLLYRSNEPSTEILDFKIIEQCDFEKNFAW